MNGYEGKIYIWDKIFKEEEIKQIYFKETLDPMSIGFGMVSVP